MLFLTLALACDLSKFGAYDCEAYCDQVIAKTETCTQAAIDAQCAELGDTACKAATESDLSTYASQSRSDWAGQGRRELVDSCNADIAESGKTEAQCLAETGTINNITCDDLLGLLETLGGQ